jgi:hypothetical protein
LKVKEVLVTTLFIEIVIVCLFFAFLHINLESTIALIIFNGLFISIIFQLNGSLTRKMLILTVGNVLGVFCNFLFFQFSDAGVKYFGTIFTAFYSLIFPFVNITWIVPFWSFSVSFLTTKNS